MSKVSEFSQIDVAERQPFGTALPYKTAVVIVAYHHDDTRRLLASSPIRPVRVRLYRHQRDTAAADDLPDARAATAGSTAAAAGPRPEHANTAHAAGLIRPPLYWVFSGRVRCAATPDTGVPAHHC